MNESPNRRRLPKVVWILAYLISPAVPFVCLRIEGAVSTLQCALGVCAALLAHLGIISVLEGTNGNPAQIFIELLLGTSMYLIILWHYLAGHAAKLWSVEAEQQWRTAGRFFGTIIALGLALAILTFHLRPR